MTDKWHRRDYQMIASVINEALGESLYNGAVDAETKQRILQDIRDKFSYVFRVDNPEYQESLFREACGVKNVGL